MEIALQLWTVRGLAEADMASALCEVAAIGYGAVEFAGFGSARPEAVRRALGAAGLRAASAHVPYAALQAGLDRVVADMRMIACPQVVVPAFGRELRDTPERAFALAESLNAIGAHLADAGLAFAYHNEDYDFAPLGESTLWDILVARTDPGLVQLQLDVFTARLMGRDPIVLMRQHGARITSLHVCDMRAGGYVPIGQGETDWPALLSTARDTAARWLIVEHDAPPHPLDDARASLLALRTPDA